MEEKSRTGKVQRAAMKADVHRNTATKYLKAGKLPSEMVKERTWRTRKDPFEDVWEAEVEARLIEAPELEAKTLFEHLMAIGGPDRYEPGQVRTLQRRVREWRARNGPDKEVMFPQVHRPGEALQTDFTWAKELGITIQGRPFPHLLCHVVLPYSNWQWATICRSESLVALRSGVQAAAYRLGRVTEWHQTDNSTAATHTPAAGDRKFNEEYLALMRHLGMKPRTIEIGKKNQNGDVEALNGALKRRLNQHLLMRGSREFQSESAYQTWLGESLDKANALRITRLNEELAVMKIIPVHRLPEYREKRVTVLTPSTISICKKTYSVPARLIGEEVDVRIYEDRLEVFYRGEHELTVERVLGAGSHRINYRHVIWWLVQKPEAFRRYRYREDLFPTPLFRKAYDHLVEKLGEHRANRDYLRVLHLAASTMESDVEMGLSLLIEEGQVPTYDQVKSLVTPTAPHVPEIQPLTVDLSTYDQLLEQRAEA